MKTEKSALHTHSIKHLSLIKSLSLEEQSSVSIKQPAHIHFSGFFVIHSSADKRTPIPKLQGRQFLRQRKFNLLYFGLRVKLH